MRILTTLVALPLMFACADPGRDTAGHDSAAPAPAAMTVRLERVSVDQWSLIYVLSRPVAELDFGPPVGDLRAMSWRPEAEFKLAVADGTERLRRRDGAPFERADLQLTTYDELIPKQYVPFNTFSDGGVTVYTGFLVAKGEAAGASFEPETGIELVPRRGEAVVIDGTQHEGVATWIPPAGTPAFVYFGEAEPIASEALVAIVDPSTPDWVRGRLEAFLPRVFAYLEERFERRLSRRPTVLVSARFDDGNRGYSIKGGALEGQIQVRLRGEQVRVPGSGVDDYLFKFIAHEGAHLWQGADAFDNATAWIHEGGADAIALRAIEELGVWPRQRVDEAIAAAADGCAQRLEEGITLTSASEEGAFDALYSCGLVIAAATEAAVRQADPEADLFTFWRCLAELAGRTEEGFTAEQYFACLQDLGVSRERTRSLSDFVERPPTDPGGAIEALLAPRD